MSHRRIHPWTGPVVALGDSYTIGESVAPEERWPAVLARRLAVDRMPPLVLPMLRPASATP